MSTAYVPGTQRVQSVTASDYANVSGSCQPVGRTTSFEYNTAFAAANGLPTHIRGPRAGVADDLTLAYHECSGSNHCGRLAAITNAAGHVTTFDSYDARGRLLQATDPNGVVTVYGYDPRGRLTTITATPPAGPARVTAYTYTADGRLHTAEAANGTVLTYAI